MSETTNEQQADLGEKTENGQQQEPEPKGESPVRREDARRLCYAVFVAAIRQAIASSTPTEEEISRRLGRRKDFVTTALAQPETLTIRNVGSILWACGVEVDDVRAEPLNLAPFVSEGPQE